MCNLDQELPYRATPLDCAYPTKHLSLYVNLLSGLVSGWPAGDTVVPRVKKLSSGGHQRVSPSSHYIQVIRQHLMWPFGRYFTLPITEVQCFSVLPVSHVPAWSWPLFLAPVPAPVPDPDLCFHFLYLLLCLTLVPGSCACFCTWFWSWDLLLWPTLCSLLPVPCSLIPLFPVPNLPCLCVFLLPVHS